MFADNGKDFFLFVVLNIRSAVEFEIIQVLQSMLSTL